VKRWIGELAHVPLEAWYGRPSRSPQLMLSLHAENVYPKPVVDHAVAARAFLRRYREFVAARLPLESGRRANCLQPEP